MVLGLCHGISEDPKVDVGSLSKGEDEGRNKLNDEPNATRHETSTLHTRRTYEQVEHVKAESAQRDAELEAELENAKAEIEELKASVVLKEIESCNVKVENKALSTKIKELRERESKLKLELNEFALDLGKIRTRLSLKENELDDVVEEIHDLREQIEEACWALAETARAAKQEALLKPGHLSEEADKSSGRVERLTEQLDEAQAANTELEAKSRRSKVPSDQLRKDAEEAAMFSTGNNGKFTERTRSLDRAYSPVTGDMGSPYSKGMDDDLPEKKNGSLRKRTGAMKKIGVL